MPKRTDIKKVLVIGSGDVYKRQEQILIVVNGFDDRAEEQQELCVLIGGLAGSEEVDSGIRSHGPVVEMCIRDSSLRADYLRGDAVLAL